MDSTITQTPLSRLSFGSQVSKITTVTKTCIGRLSALQFVTTGTYILIRLYGGFKIASLIICIAPPPLDCGNERPGPGRSRVPIRLGHCCFPKHSPGVCLSPLNLLASQTLPDKGEACVSQRGSRQQVRRSACGHSIPHGIHHTVDLGRGRQEQCFIYV